MTPAQTRRASLQERSVAELQKRARTGPRREAVRSGAEVRDSGQGGSHFGLSAAQGLAVLAPQAQSAVHALLDLRSATEPDAARRVPSAATQAVAETAPAAPQQTVLLGSASSSSVPPFADAGNGRASSPSAQAAQLRLLPAPVPSGVPVMTVQQWQAERVIPRDLGTLSDGSAVIIHVRSDSKQAAVQIADTKRDVVAFPRSLGDKIKAWKDLYQRDSEYRQGFRRLMLANPLCDGLVEGAVLMTVGLVNQENAKAAMTLLAISPLLSNSVSSLFFLTGSHWRDNAQHDAINKAGDQLGQLKQKLNNATIIYHNAWMDIGIAATLALELAAVRYLHKFGPISTATCLAITKTAISAIDLRDSGAWNSFRYQLKDSSENPWSRTVVQMPNFISSIEMSFSTVVYAIGVVIAYRSLSAIGIDSDFEFGLSVGLIALSGVLGAGPRISYTKEISRTLKAEIDSLQNPSALPPE